MITVAVSPVTVTGLTFEAVAQDDCALVMVRASRR